MSKWVLASDGRTLAHRQEPAASRAAGPAGPPAEDIN